MIANIIGPDLGIVVVLILVVLIGGSQLPKLARNLGLAGKEFRKAHDEAMVDQPAAVPAPPAPLNPVTPSVPSSSDQVTLSRADLDALLSEREARVQRDANS
jgi:sec-independent protein translocase protein TatA